MSKVVYKKVNKLKNTEKAYVAGIVDGEGSVTLTIKQRGATRHLAITISNNEINLLKYIIKIVGAGIITNKRSYKKEHSPSYTYALYGRQAIDLLEQIVFYLKTYKKQRSILVLRDYISVTPRNGKYTEVMRRRKERFVGKFFSIIPSTKKAVL